MKEQDGRSDFIRTDKFVLDFRLLPLLKKELVINEVELDSPYIIVKRLKNGLYNYSDIKEKLKAGKPAPEKAPQKNVRAFAVNIEKIIVKNAKAEFVDETGKLPNATGIADADLKITAPPGLANIQAPVSGEIDLKSLRAELKNKNKSTSANISGRINLGNRIKLSLLAQIGRDTIKINGSAANYMKAPVIVMNVSSERLDLERLMLLVPSGGEKAPAKKRAPPAKEKARPVSASGSISVKSALYKGFVLNGFLLDYKYRDGILTANPVKTAVTGGNKVLVDGSILGSVSLYTADPKRTLNGQGGADFRKIAVRQSPITRQVAIILGMPELATPTFTGSKLNYLMKNGDVLLNGYMDSPQLEFNPVKATVGVAAKTIAATADLKLSPMLAGRITKSRYLHFLTDNRGWTVVPLKITGTAGKPKVGIDTARLGKAAGKELKKRIERQLQKLFK